MMRILHVTCLPLIIKQTDELFVVIKPLVTPARRLKLRKSESPRKPLKHVKEERLLAELIILYKRKVTEIVALIEELQVRWEVYYYNKYMIISHICRVNGFNIIIL